MRRGLRSGSREQVQIARHQMNIKKLLIKQKHNVGLSQADEWCT